MIVVVGKMRIRPEAKDEVVAASAIATAATEAEAGNAGYRFGFDTTDADVLHVIEIWEDDDAMAAHFAEPHLAELSTVLAGAVVEKPEFIRHDVSASRPLFG